MSLNAVEAGVRIASRRWIVPASNLSLQPGQLSAVLGPNGAGKSTWMKLLCGLIAPSTGSVRLNGHPVEPRRAHCLAKLRAVVLQEHEVAFEFSLRDIVAMGRLPHRHRPSAHEDTIIEAAMRLTDVHHLAERIYASLSGGEKARAQIARALAQVWEPCPDGQPRWLLLDEPTAALDLHHQHQVLGVLKTLVRTEGLGVVMVLHDLNLALRYADHAVVFDPGGLPLQGPVDKVLNADAIERIWRVQSASVHMVDGVRQMVFTRKCQ